MLRGELDIHPRQITNQEQIPPRENFTPVSQVEAGIKHFDGFDNLLRHQQDALTHYAGTVAYYFGLRVHSRVFPNTEDRIMIASAAPSPETLITEQEQLVESGVPERFIRAADLIGQTIAIDMVAERAERAMQNTQDLYQKRTD